MFRRRVDVAWKVVALSDTNSVGMPNRLLKRLRAMTKWEPDWDGTTSSATALVAVQVNKTTYARVFEERWNAPVKSTPVE